MPSSPTPCLSQSPGVILALASISPQRLRRSMTLDVRPVAVAITAILHAVSGFFLSILALSLQRLFPSLKQLPPSFDHVYDFAQYFPPRRDSGYPIHSVTSESVSSNESLQTPSTLDSDPKISDDRTALLLASQARARAARPSLFALPSSLWTLKEYPSSKPSQPGEEHRMTTLSGAPPDTLCDGPSIASFRFSIPLHEEQTSEVSSVELKRPHSHHCLFPLLVHRKGCHSLSAPLSRHKSSSSPHLQEAATFSGSSSNNHNHRHISVSEHVRKIVEIAPVRRCKDRKRKVEKNQAFESASRVGRGRTDPYRAPYFFPSPVSPWAHDYARLARLDRNLVLNPDVPASPSAPVCPEDARRRMPSWPGERMRSMWAPLHRRSLSHGVDPWP